MHQASLDGGDIDKGARIQGVTRQRYDPTGIMSQDFKVIIPRIWTMESTKDLIK